jgi:hypothetical protein
MEEYTFPHDRTIRFRDEEQLLLMLTLALQAIRMKNYSKSQKASAMRLTMEIIDGLNDGNI